MLYDRDNNINNGKTEDSFPYINNFKDDIPEISLLPIIILVVFIFLIVGVIYLFLG